MAPSPFRLVKGALRGVLLVATLAATPVAARGAPRACDLPVSVVPSPLSPNVKTAHVSFPSSAADAQVGATSGTTSAPVKAGPGQLSAEYVLAADVPPFAVVAVVGPTVCGYAVVPSSAAASIGPVASAPMLVMVEPPAATAERDATVLVYVFAIDENGVLRRDRAPDFRPTTGTVSAVEAMGPGVWRARWKLPPGPAMAAGVTASFGAESAGMASLTRNPGPPAAIVIAPDEAAGGGGAGPSGILVSVRDAAGNYTDGTVELESDVGEVSEPQRVERGVYRANVTAPPGTRADAVVVIARAGRAVATTTLAVAPSAAAFVKVATPAPVRADGENRTSLDVVVTDAYGSPVDEAPEGHAARGDFGKPFNLAPGQWVLPYRPPRVTEDGTEEVEVRVGGASAKVSVELLAPRMVLALGAKGGMAYGGEKVGVSAGVDAALWWLVGGSHLGLVLDVGWWMRSSNASASVPGQATLAVDDVQNFLPILLSFGWRTPLGAGWMLWLTAGGGGAWVADRSTVTGQPTVDVSGFAPAASASAGVGPAVGPGNLFLEARVTWVGDPNLPTMSGSSVNLLGLVGYRFDVR